jgi:hypothetical protein
MNIQLSLLHVLTLKNTKNYLKGNKYNINKWNSPLARLNCYAKSFRILSIIYLRLAIKERR